MARLLNLELDVVDGRNLRLYVAIALLFLLLKLSLKGARVRHSLVELHLGLRQFITLIPLFLQDSDLGQVTALLTLAL